MARRDMASGKAEHAGRPTAGFASPEALIAAPGPARGGTARPGLLAVLQARPPAFPSGAHVAGPQARPVAQLTFTLRDGPARAGRRPP